MQSRDHKRRLAPVGMLICAALAATACLPATASATDLLNTKLRAAKAKKRDCTDGVFAGRRGVKIRRVTAADSGLLRTRLGARRGDWDLAVFNARTKRLITASTGFRSREVAEGFVLDGQQRHRSGMPPQGARTSGGDRRRDDRAGPVEAEDPARARCRRLAGRGHAAGVERLRPDRARPGRLPRRARARQGRSPPPAQGKLRLRRADRGRRVRGSRDAAALRRKAGARRRHSLGGGARSR